MAQSDQIRSNTAAAILALVCLFYILAPTPVFIGALIVIPIVGLSIAAWCGYTFQDRQD